MEMGVCDWDREIPTVGVGWGFQIAALRWMKRTRRGQTEGKANAVNPELIQ